MGAFDNDFGPIKRCTTSAHPSNIIKSGLEEQDQNHKLKKIKLITKEMHASQQEEDELTSAQKSILHRLPLQVAPNSSGQSSTVCGATAADPQAFEELKTMLLRKLNNRLPPEESGLPEFVRSASNEVERILVQSVIQKESHSAILVSPRSWYKTSIINHHLARLRRQHDQQFVTVRLNGLIHTENAAINSIATQLENELRRVRKDVPATDFQLSQGSLTEVFENILKLLNTVAVQMGRSSSVLPRSAKLTVIFIFDEIDQFAGPIRQTLLYNLFDMVEHARVPVCIVGCTTKLNILEFLEKRVKSRFSQRLIFVPQITSYQSFCKEVIRILSIGRPGPYTHAWDKKVKSELEDEQTELSCLVKGNYETFRDLALLKNAFVSMVGAADSFDSLLCSLVNCNTLKLYNKLQLSNSLVNRVRALGELELVILLSAARVALKNEENVNFNLMYEEYSKLVKGLNSRIPASSSLSDTGISIEHAVRIWNKKDIKSIWETLIELELLVERGIIAIRQSAQAAFQATNHYSANSVMPYDLKMFQVPITLHELRRVVSKSSMFYSWTQL
ncbi:ABR178Cp [Eremothecium gossypii ATCC 10895]|uniref:Origin recognition complex subunit 4 n=1 Tax=Eremothecium gossypii (strain ATCC 10895 / CBS 109.51 / FGSC 9923 / NRRL Y-1056) TaxID=284811 RepID=Q75D45_EREGS|nr:ABR178Cp [Eremothecium gossypii ATCC 10895]AAS50950.1 ABR178Cp [Eremothecium gossypii ATCC 10895]AEY95240.1 FABR178Cp [Eremothecium gossypii FDAG1]